MPDTQVQVQTVWTLQDQVTPQMQPMERQAEQTAASMSRLQAGIKAVDSVASKLAGFGLATMGLGNLGHAIGRIVDMASGVEQTRLQLATMLWQTQQSGATEGMTSFADALGYAKTATADLATMAASGVGSTQEYVTAWQSVLLPVTRAGGSIQTVMDLTRQLVPLARASGVGVEEAGGATLRLLSGMAPVRSRFIQLMGITEAKEVAALAKTNPQESLAKLMALIARSKDVAPEGGKTFAGVWSTALDAGKKLLKEVVVPLLPLFKALVKLMKQFLDLPPIRLAAGLLSKMLGLVSEITDALAETVGWLLPTDMGKAIHNAFSEHGRDLGGITTRQRTADEAAASIAELGEGMGTMVDATGQAAGGMMDVAGAAGAAATRLDKLAPKGAEEWQAIAKGLIAGGGGTYAEQPMRTREQLQADLEEAFSRQGIERWKSGDRIPILNFQDFTWAWMAQQPETNGLGMRLKLGPGVEVPMTKELADVQKVFVDTVHDLGARLRVPEANRPTNVWAAAKMGGAWKEVADMFGEAMVGALRRSLPEQGVLDTAHAWLDQMGYMGWLGGNRPKVVNDFRGSHFDVKVDARHQDPDRVAGTLFNALGRAANRPIQATTDPSGVF